MEKFSVRIGRLAIEEVDVDVEASSYEEAMEKARDMDPDQWIRQGDTGDTYVYAVSASGGADIGWEEIKKPGLKLEDLLRWNIEVAGLEALPAGALKSVESALAEEAEE
jgi:hypothetical protein